MDGSIEADLADYALVVRIADAGGFSPAARQSGIPQATISRRIKALEQRIGLRLFERTSRRVVLTSTGEAICERARRMLVEAESLRGIVLDARGVLFGPLRVTAPVMLGQIFVADLCARFMAAHPTVTIALELTGRSVDLIEEGVDVAIVVGDLADSSLAVTMLGESRSGFFAAPGYLERRGIPRSPRDLEEGHALLLTGETAIPPSRPRRITLWPSDGDGPETLIMVVPTLVSNDATPLRVAALAGLGIALFPRAAMAGAVASGKLVEVLTGWALPPKPVSALTAAHRGSLPVVRAFLAALRAELPDRLSSAFSTSNGCGAPREAG